MNQENGQSEEFLGVNWKRFWRGIKFFAVGAMGIVGPAMIQDLANRVNWLSFLKENFSYWCCCQTQVFGIIGIAIGSLLILASNPRQEDRPQPIKWRYKDQ